MATSNVSSIFSLNSVMPEFKNQAVIHPYIINMSILVRTNMFLDGSSVPVENVMWI
jgi:hypothetical protein